MVLDMGPRQLQKEEARLMLAPRCWKTEKTSWLAGSELSNISRPQLATSSGASLF
jgi:hypothetical protein